MNSSCSATALRRFPSVIPRVLIMLCVSAPLSLRAAENPPTPPSPAPPISYRIVEKAFDGSYPITEATRIVDANSDIDVNFALPSTTATAAPSPEWARLNQVLASVEQTFQKVAALRAELQTLDRADAAAVAKLKAANQTIGELIVADVSRWQAELGLADNGDAYDRIVSGRFDGKYNPLLYYANLARWIRAELERLNQSTTSFANAHAAVVTVQAFHSSLGSTRQAVHVDGFDNIPAGDLQPIDRTGLRLTPAEQAQLNMQVKMAQQAVATIQEITQSSGQIKTQVQTLLTQLKAQLAALEAALDRKPADWAEKLVDPAFTQPLEAIAQNTALPEAQRNAASSVLLALKAFKADYDAINSLILQIQVVRNSISDKPDLAQLITVASGISQRINTFANSVLSLQKSIETWPKRIEDIATGLQTIGTTLTPEQKTALIPSELKEFGAAIKGDFPVTIDFAKQIVLLLNDHGMSSAADTLAGVDPTSIWRDTTNLTPGKIELTRAGIAQGDEMLVRIAYRQKTATGAPGPLLATESYKLETDLMGFHRKYGAAVIFARGTGSTPAERQWKPSVSANVHWFYRRRDPEGAWKLWNAINPGLGVHVATLNQGTDAIEFGVGPSLSLFDGLITGAIGRNLSNDQRTYYALGLSLFDTLEQVKKFGVGQPR